MKEKKTKRTRKVLLMGIASVLVAAVSVSATLAYLTAQTSPVTNTFTGSGGITGQIEEPQWTANGSDDGNFIVGKPTTKDPLIANTTSDAAIYVGAKVSFWIDVTDDSTDNYVQVSPAVFASYVDVKYGSDASYNTGTGDTQWTQKTSPTGDNSLYFIYNSILKKKDSDPSYSASSYATDKDNTSPIFDSVTVKPAVKIDKNNPTTSSQINLSNGPDSQTFPVFNYKIVINGYGQKAYAVNATTGVQEGDTLVTKTEAADLIFEKLKVITPSV